MKHQDGNNVQCCPKFDPAKWNEKNSFWKDKLFIKDTIPQIFHIPFPPLLGKKMARMWASAQAAGAAPALEDFLFLATDPSPWKSELYMAVTKEVPNEKTVKFTGEFLSKVFDGPYNAVPKWIEEMEPFIVSQGKIVKKYYVYFTTCPKCAKLYGHNYAVVFAEV
ncbi:MAG: hydrolase [Elusimicrobiota bacterium]